jgi:hypothetical protein
VEFCKHTSQPSSLPTLIPCRKLFREKWKRKVLSQERVHAIVAQNQKFTITCTHAKWCDQFLKTYWIHVHVVKRVNHWRITCTQMLLLLCFWFGVLQVTFHALCITKFVTVERFPLFCVFRCNACNRGLHWKLSSREFYFWPCTAQVEVNNGFRGITISKVTYCKHYLLHYTQQTISLYWIDHCCAMFCIVMQVFMFITDTLKSEICKA